MLQSTSAPDSLADIPHDAAHITSNFLQMMESSSLYPEGSSSVRQLSKAPQHSRGDFVQLQPHAPPLEGCQAQPCAPSNPHAGCLHKHREKTAQSFPKLQFSI